MPTISRGRGRGARIINAEGAHDKRQHNGRRHDLTAKTTQMSSTNYARERHQTEPPAHPADPFPTYTYKPTPASRHQNGRHQTTSPTNTAPTSSDNRTSDEMNATQRDTQRGKKQHTKKRPSKKKAQQKTTTQQLFNFNLHDVRIYTHKKVKKITPHLHLREQQPPQVRHRGAGRAADPDRHPRDGGRSL